MNKWWPLPYSGLPALMSSLSLVCFTGGILLNLIKPSISSLIATPVIAMGFITALLSVGRDVELIEDGVVLKYGFPKVVLKYVVRDVVGVFDVNELRRGNLLRYFKYHIFLFSLIIALPITYLIIKGIYPNPAYLPILLIPVFLGVVLLIYIAFTADSYKKLLRRITPVISTAWVSVGFVVGITYREVYRESLLSNPSAFALYMLGMLLLATSTIVLIALMSRRHVVIIEASNGKFYAVGTLGNAEAKELIRSVLEVIARNAEVTS